MAFGILYKIKKTQYQMALAKVKRSKAFWRGRRSISSTESKADPATNRDRAVVELYRFQQRKKAKPFVAYLKDRKITIWPGQRICDVTHRSSGRTGFPGYSSKRPERVTVHAKCIDGHSYIGRGPGDGMYIRMKPAAKRSRR